MTEVALETMPKIEIVNGKAAGVVVELSGSTITLGNRRNATVEIKDPWVSFNHAQITRDGDRFFVADARSKAGTFLNEKKIDRTPVLLSPNDRIVLGKTEIRFLADGAALSGAGASQAPAAAPAPVTGHAIPAAYQAAAAAFKGQAPPQTAGISTTQPIAVPPPFAAPPAPGGFAPLPPESQEKLASLERDLAQAQRDLKTLRETHVTRERKLSETLAKLREAETRVAAPPPPPPPPPPPAQDSQLVADLAAARAEAAEYRKKGEELAAKARAKIEELTRYAREIEARAQAQGPDAAALVEKEREISHLREEVRRITDEARTRLAQAAEKMQQEMAAHEAAQASSSNQASSQALKEAEERASLAERESGSLRIKLEDKETEIRELKLKLDAPSPLEKELKQARAELKGYEEALEERNKDVARLEATVEKLSSGAPSQAAAASAGKPSDGELVALRAELEAAKKDAQAQTQRAEGFQKTVIDLRTQLEELNQDMLVQEDELRAEITELERRLGESAGAQPQA